MPDMHDVNKMRITILLPIKLVKRIDLLAQEGKSIGLSRAEVVLTLLNRQTELTSIPLSEDDLKWCNEQVRKNQNAQHRK